MSTAAVCGGRAALLLAVVLVTASGCTSMLLGGGGSAGRPIGADTRSSSAVADDERIRVIIRDRFAADRYLQGAAIDIDVRRGVVTLRGSVDRYAFRDQAIRLATDVAGVRRVVNQIVIGR